MFGGGAFYLLKEVVPGRMTGSYGPVWAPIMSVLAWGFLAIFVAGAMASMARRLSERRILKRARSIQQVRALSWHDFERLMTEALRPKGFSARRTAGGADGGVDIVLESKGGNILVQCKHWKSTKIGVKPIRELAGVVAAQGAMGGIFACSGRYTKEAKVFAEQAKIELIDGEALVEMLNLGDDSGTSNNSGKFCPNCDGTLVPRVAKRGKHAGRQFHGCSNYPACRYIDKTT